MLLTSAALREVALGMDYSLGISYGVSKFAPVFAVERAYWTVCHLSQSKNNSDASNSGKRQRWICVLRMRIGMSGRDRSKDLLCSAVRKALLSAGSHHSDEFI
jgi:hypothetical protein